MVAQSSFEAQSITQLAQALPTFAGSGPVPPYAMSCERSEPVQGPIGPPTRGARVLHNAPLHAQASTTAAQPAVVGSVRVRRSA